MGLAYHWDLNLILALLSDIFAILSIIVAFLLFGKAHRQLEDFKVESRAQLKKFKAEMKKFIDEYSFYSERDRHLNMYANFSYRLSKKLTKEERNEIKLMIINDYQPVVKKIFSHFKEQVIEVYRNDSDFENKRNSTVYKIEVMKEKENSMLMPVIYPSRKERDLRKVYYLIKIEEKIEGSDILDTQKLHYFAFFDWTESILDDDSKILKRKGNWFLSKSSEGKGDQHAERYPFHFIEKQIPDTGTVADNFVKNS